MKNKTLTCVILCICTTLLTTGCFSAKAPDNIYINAGPEPADVDSSRIPPTETHEQARAELERAYQQIRYLEHQNRRCQEDLQEAEEDAEKYEEKYERLKDKYDD